MKLKKNLPIYFRLFGQQNEQSNARIVHGPKLEESFL